MVISLHVPVWQCDFIRGGIRCLPQYALRMLAEGVPLFMAVNGFLMFRRKSFDLRMHMRKIFRIFLLSLIWG